MSVASLFAYVCITGCSKCLCVYLRYVLTLTDNVCLLKKGSCQSRQRRWQNNGFSTVHPRWWKINTTICSFYAIIYSCNTTIYSFNTTISVKQWANKAIYVNCEQKCNVILVQHLQSQFHTTSSLGRYICARLIALYTCTPERWDMPLRPQSSGCATPLHPVRQVQCIAYLHAPDAQQHWHNQDLVLPQCQCTRTRLSLPTSLINGHLNVKIFHARLLLPRCEYMYCTECCYG
jgi:hypothetical protein